MKLSLCSLILILLTFSCQKKPLVNEITLEKSGQYYEGHFTCKYNFGDYISYNSPVNGSGKGVIVDLTVGPDGGLSYGVEQKLKDGSIEIQPGIYDEDITLLKRKSN